MKIHYFQRYHSSENVATANTMLLLSRLYHYSSEKFYRFLKTEFFSDSFEPEIIIAMQEKNYDEKNEQENEVKGGNSIPDATITQESFKIVVETKLSDSFDIDQLKRHLSSFKDARYKVLLTLAPVPMNELTKKNVELLLEEYNASQSRPVIHKNMTFESIANAIQEVVDDKDYEIQEILDDYLDYCSYDNLIVGLDAWKYLRVQLAGTTIDFNTKANLYYDNADRGFRPHDYLGLYTNKSVRAIGKITARIIAIGSESGMVFKEEFGEITEERKNIIQLAIEDGLKRGYDLRESKHRYFFVEKFVETDFKKVTPRAPMGSRVFDLTQVLETGRIPSVQEMAELLKTKTWA